MPRLTKRVPKYRHHKATGQAVVSINGRDHYLGKHGTDVSRRRYDDLIADYLKSGREDPVPGPASIEETTIADLILGFWKEKRTYYFKNGKPTSEHSAYKSVLKVLNARYSTTPAKDFGPLALKSLREVWVDQGLFRKTINHNQARVVRIFKWGVENERVTAATWQALKAVEGLKKGRTIAPEPVPILPVPEDAVEKTCEQLSPVLQAMIRIQMLTGARPGEVCKMRPGDIDRSGDVWVYRPMSHKTEHHDRMRQIFIGAAAQRVLTPYLLRAADANCFSAAESREWYRDQAERERTTPPSCGNARGRRSQRRHGPKTRQPRTYFDTQTYAQAIARGCRKAWPAPSEIRFDKIAAKQWEDDHRWAPNQLRHNWATRVRSKYGLEAAQVGLGHANANVTQIYAERDSKLAMKVAREIG